MGSGCVYYTIYFQINTSEVLINSSELQASTSEVLIISSELQASTSELLIISSELQAGTSEVPPIGFFVAAKGKKKGRLVWRPFKLFIPLWVLLFLQLLVCFFQSVFLNLRKSIWRREHQIWQPVFNIVFGNRTMLVFTGILALASIVWLNIDKLKMTKTSA